jgi:hypothetical protein
MYDTQKKSFSKALANTATDQCHQFLKPLLKQLDRTLANTVTAIVRHRQRPTALLLSELGTYLIDPQHAPCGTKRLANLIHSHHWQSHDIEDYQSAQSPATD